MSKRSRPGREGAVNTQDLVHIDPRLRTFATPIGDLTQDPANARKHPERSVEAIAASLKRFGQRKPIVIDDAGVIVAGNGMHMAAMALGWTHLAAIKTELVGVERAAYAIADNRTAELSEWDLGALLQLVNAMPGEDLGNMGFTRDEFEKLIAGDAEQQPTIQDEIPAPGEVAISKPGDLWILGEHRLLCGDCTNPSDVARVMNGQKARLFATDPPYLVGYDGTNHPGKRENKSKDWSESYGPSWDEFDENSQLYTKFIAAAIPHLDDDAAWYCWYASRRHTLLESAWIAAGVLPHCQIIWAKNRPIITRTWYMWQHEPCLMGWRKGDMPKKIPGQPMLTTVWSIDTIPNGEARPDHPTPKPLECFAIPMRQHTRESELVFEPFSGSGTQIIVAEQLGRRCAAIEIQPLYVDVAVKRWEKLTGKKAKRMK